MWEERIRQISPSVVFSSPADHTDILRVEQSLEISLPDELVALLNETNGLIEAYGAEIIWACDKIVLQNRMFRDDEEFRDLYMPFDHLLLFGDDGTGNMFAYAIQNGLIRRPLDIYMWDHETDSRSFWAFTLDGYLKRALEHGDALQT